MINYEIVIKTKRLNMRRFNENDLDYLYEITSNPSVMRYFPKTLDRAETDDLLHKIVKNYELKGTSFWAAFTNETKDFVGMCGLLHQTIDNLEELEIAYRIVERYWYNGYATELAEACRDNALNILGKERVISLIRPDNIPSKKVATKIGLKYSKNVSFIDLEHELYCMNKVL